MTHADFIYTTYIKSTPEKVWTALTNPEFTRQYWGYENISDWKKGSKWSHIKAGDPQRTVKMGGEVLESSPPRRLVMTWVDPTDPSDKAKQSRLTYQIEAVEGMVRLDIIHDKLSEDMGRKISGGWPRVLSSLKSFLETGKALDTWAGHESSCSTTSAKAANA